MKIQHPVAFAVYICLAQILSDLCWPQLGLPNKYVERTESYEKCSNRDASECVCGYLYLYLHLHLRTGMHIYLPTFTYAAFEATRVFGQTQRLVQTKLPAIDLP